MDLFRTLIFYFIVYSFIGWIIEGLFNLCTKGSFLKPNFLIFPLKPMYGIAATLLIYIKAFSPTWLFLVSAFIVPTLVEYYTAALMFHLYNLKYWDYSNCPHHHKGYICLRFSIYWFFLSVILTYGLQPFMTLFYKQISWLWYYLCPITFTIFMLDFIITLRHKHLNKHVSPIH